MSFFTFLEEKITEILFQLFFLAVVAFLLIFYGVDTLFVVSLVILFISIQGLFQWCLYRKKRNASQHIIDLVDGLEETYYIADVLPKPKEFQNKAYCYALKKACKSMNDEIGKITEEKQDYQEYVESFVHEIKIPIGALSLTFDNTKNYTLKKETDKIFQLVEQMLYYARSENTEKDYFVKQLQLDEVIHNVILKFRHSLMERKTIINIHDIENVIYTDEKWLTFILSQIVQNAIKYFDKQENKLTIYSQDNGTNILLVVEDNGCGISEQDLPHIFDRFYQCGTQQSSGTGIGLSLVYELIQLHHGKISVTSTIEVGTTFNVSIPITQHYYKEEEINQSHIQEEQQSNLLQEESPVQLSASKQIILVIEDDYDMRKYLHQYLSPHFEVLTEDNAFSGYETALKYIPNLIITDIMMPGMNGLELCNKLKNDFHTSHIPVIILTAKAAEEDLLKGYQSGAEIYITKPFNPDSLILQVRNMISLKKYQERNTLNTNDDDTNENKDYIALDEREQKFINKLNNWLELHLEETDYNIEDICKEIGTSRMQLHRKLTALLGQSASEFIRCYKMKRAKELLESGNFNVSEVVYKTGFKNNSHFTKTFKKTYGHLPSELL